MLKSHVAAFLVLILCGCHRTTPAAREEPAPPDEAKKNGLTAAAFRYPIDEAHNFLKGMDVIAIPVTEADDVSQEKLLGQPPDQLMDKVMPPPRRLVDRVSTPNEILGRNTWMLWCGGNEGFWDWLGTHGYGFTDLLKVIDTRHRARRFDEAGLINEPGMTSATKQDENGIWLDVPVDQIQEREKAKVPPTIYGRSTGVIGLRLFPNPEFKDTAKASWNPKRYYDDPSYYNNPGLVRPYRVGMSCAFCHASWHPLRPPQDITQPKWENISGNIGAQYLRMRAVFGNLLKPDNFVYHLLDSQPPGTIDTSLIASDNINNPNAMNSIFNLPQRVIRSFQNPPEVQGAAALTQPALWRNPTAVREKNESVWPREGNGFGYESKEADKVPQLYWTLFDNTHDPDVLPRVNGSNEGRRYVPRILFDGADSIGGWGALARVYLNIGTYWEQWIRIHNPLVGFEPQKSFTIKDCEDNSVYWRATQERVAPLRDYFLKISAPMPVLAATGAEHKADTIDPTVLVPNETWNVIAAREHKSETPARPTIPGVAIGDSGPPVIGAPPGPAGTGSGSKVTSEKANADAILARERGRRIDPSQLRRGRRVFANNCIVCHSSVQPPFWTAALTEDAWGKQGQEKKPAELWDHDPGHWLLEPKYKEWAENAVETAAFWQLNYLSTDYRLPVSLIRTNSARALATNALGGHMWSDFSSQSYKEMPFVGAITYFDPFTQQEKQFTPKHKSPPGSPEGGGGVGFYRPATLVSIWSTAPLLHNNSLGLFNNNPSVDGRLDAFDDAIRKLLWPAKRLESSSFNGATPERLKRDHGLIWRTPEVTYLTLPGEQVPQILAKLPFLKKWIKQYAEWGKGHPEEQKLLSVPWAISLGLFVVAYLFFVLGGRKASREPTVVLHRKWWARTLGYLFVFAALVIGALLYTLGGRLGEVRIGPIPKGTPVNLLANTNPEADPKLIKKTLGTTVHALVEIDSRHLSEEEANKLMSEKVAPALMNISKCPDFVMDEGHYFKWFDSMTEEDKNALIELLKTF
jgi:mono/diheme cytochrome c family protein